MHGIYYDIMYIIIKKFNPNDIHEIESQLRRNKITRFRFDKNKTFASTSF